MQGHFTIFSRENSPYDRYDNLGGGHCGYYALMMGIIHLAKSPTTSERMQLTITNWKTLDPDIGTSLDRALAPETNILDTTRNQQLAFCLQKSLRKILANQYILSIPQEFQNLQITNSYAFDQFKFLVESVDPMSSMIYEDMIANPLCNPQYLALRKIACAISRHLQNIKYPHHQMYQMLVHDQFLAAAFVRFRQEISDAYRQYYIGTPERPSTKWATEQCLLRFADADCLNIPIQILKNGRPLEAGRLSLNELGVRLNNELDSHWTLYLPKEGALQHQAVPLIQNIDDNAYIISRRKQMMDERNLFNAQKKAYLLEQQQDLVSERMLNDLDEQVTQELSVAQYDAIRIKYINLNALYSTHYALHQHLARRNNADDNLHYDERYLRLELQRCQVPFKVDLNEEQKNEQRMQIENEKDQLKSDTIQQIRNNALFKQQVENLSPKDTIREPRQESGRRAQTYQPNKKLRTLRRRKPSSPYPGYALNAGVGGLILGGIVVACSPELVAATAGAISFSPIGAVFLLLVASMIITTMLSLLTLYLIEKSKPSVAPIR
jgi:hypothetical protein